jgi:hypothetical protein
LVGTIFANNFLDTGDRIIDLLLYGGDGLLSTTDFEIPAISAGTATYHPPLDRSVSYIFDVTNIVQSIIDGGYDFVGVRFAALNMQAPSQLNPDALPTLELIAVPEPSSLILLGFGFLSLMLFLKRSVKLMG